MYSLSDVNVPAIGGVRTLLVAGFSSDALYTYATAERHTITAIAGLSGWQRFDLTDAAQAAAPGKPSKAGWQYAHQLDLSAPGLSTARAYVATALQAGPVVALVQDFSGQWWLLGQQLGLLLQGEGWSTGATKAESGTPLVLGRTEEHRPRRVATSFLNLLYNSSTQFSEAPTV